MSRARLLRFLLAGCAMGCGTDTFSLADAGSAPDAGRDTSTAPGMTCGTSVCGPLQTCCVTLYGGGPGAAQYRCEVACATDAGGAVSALRCTSTADCAPAGVCCIQHTNNVSVASCAPQCDPQLNEVQLCDPSASDAGCPLQPMLHVEHRGLDAPELRRVWDVRRPGRSLSEPT